MMIRLFCMALLWSSFFIRALSIPMGSSGTSGMAPIPVQFLMRITNKSERSEIAWRVMEVGCPTAPIVCQGIVGEMTPYLGYMDETMRKLRNIRLLEGRMPEGEDEVAVEIDTLYIIEPDAAVGDRIPLTIQTEAGVVYGHRYRHAEAGEKD